MAAKAIPLEELKGTTVADLFAYSGSKLLEINDWINEQLDEIAKFPCDTFHKQGYLVHSMVEVFAKTDKKEKTKALCYLAGRLWFVHNALYEQNVDLRKETVNLADKITDIEEELLVLLTEKNVLNERVLQLQQERDNETFLPSESGDLWNESYKNATRYQIITELEDRKAELAVCNDQLINLRKVYRTQVDTIVEMQSQTRAERRRSDDNDLKIQELEAALRNLKSLHASECKGECKDVIRQLENNLLRADEEIELLRKDVRTEKNRCWSAEDAVHDREINIVEKERLISQLEQENDLLVRRFSDCQEEIQTIRTRLMREIEKKDTSPRQATLEVVKTRSESDPAEQSDDREYHRRGAKPKIWIESSGDGQRKRTSTRPPPLSEDESDPEWTEPPKRKNKSKKNEINRRKRSEEEAAPHASAKSIKALRSMLPSFSKSDKTGSILEHLSLYQRLMQTLEMDSDVELRTHLSWTFASDSQSFFLSVDSKDYDTWAEYRCEVIKYFSPHRNTHEALRHALNLKCEPNQHPRDYLQLLKNAFAQVQKEVNVETKQFRDAYFYGLPINIRTQLARDYDDDRSIDWIYKQAKSVFDVSRTVENIEAKEKPKPSKVCEVNKEKELPFEAGGNKPRPAPKEKERYRSFEQKAPSAPAKEPETSDTISPRYKGNNPIPNFVYKPKDKQSEARTGEDRERPREKENKEREQYYPKEREQYYPKEREQYYPKEREQYYPKEREQYYPKEREYYPKGRQTYYPQNRERNAQDTYRQGDYDRPDYQSERREQGDNREWQETRPYTDDRDRYQQWDTRPHSPRQPNRLNALEEQLDDLTRHYKKLLTKDSGLSPRVHTVTSGEPKDQDTPRPAQ